MMDEIDIIPMNFDERIRQMAKFPEIAQREFGKAMEQSLVYLERLAKKEAPVGVSGELRSKIGHKVESVMGSEVRGTLGDGARHAAAVEKGSRPHFPPISNLAYWVDRKMRFRNGQRIYGVALAIARKIAHQGTPARPFFKTAWENGKGKVGEYFAAATNRIVKALEEK